MKKGFILISNLFILAFIAFVFIIILNTSCRKDKSEKVPNTYVNITINPSSTQYLGLNSVGGYVYLTGGVEGLIVYRMSTDEFVALDRCCTYDPGGSCDRVEVDASGLIAVDSVCGSQYLITDGSVVRGPSTQPLKRYQSQYDGYYLYITN